jgi:hypothetical protein
VAGVGVAVGATDTGAMVCTTATRCRGTCDFGRISHQPAAAAKRTSAMSAIAGPACEPERREDLLGTGSCDSSIQDIALGKI